MILTLRPLTYDDLLDMPDDGLRYEIIGGELITTPAATFGHQRVLGELLHVLYAYALAPGRGEVILGPFDVVLGRFDIVKPDLFYISSTRGRIPGASVTFDGPPDLMVEVTSPWTRRMDRIRKMALYELAGVREYWIVDPERRTLETYDLPSQDHLPAEAEADGWMASRTLPGLRVDPAEVFADLSIEERVKATMTRHNGR